MSKLQAIQIDENTTIYVEATENTLVPVATATVETGEETRRSGSKGWEQTSQVVETQVTQSFRAIENTIKTYTKYTLNAFKDAALAEVEKVSLEFGVNVSGSGGVPYIAAGTMQCNIKVTVECAFPKRPCENSQSVPQQAMHPAASQSRVPQGMPQRPPQPAQPTNPRPVGQPIG
ncbi:MAG: hypothetical protein MUF72_11520 [Elainella sp. Prado103]|jgi:hypothetical protein|nr:hypothetical protein [Elainella sp. Prado103]